MDIYQLKADATNKYLKLDKDKRTKTFKTAEALMRACENATGIATEDIEQSFLDELSEMPYNIEISVRRLIAELGYTMPKEGQN